QNVQEHRLVLRFQEFKGADQERDVVSIDRSVVAQAQLLEDHAWDNQTFDAFLDLVRELHARLAENPFYEITRFVVQVRISLARLDPVKVIRDRADIFGNRPLVVVQHDDEALGLRLYIVERFVTDPVGERGIARYHHNVLAAAFQIASHRHPERSRKRRAGVSGAVAIVLAFGAQKKTVESAKLAHR